MASTGSACCALRLASSTARSATARRRTRVSVAGAASASAVARACASLACVASATLRLDLSAHAPRAPARALGSEARLRASQRALRRSPPARRGVRRAAMRRTEPGGAHARREGLERNRSLSRFTDASKARLRAARPLASCRRRLTSFEATVARSPASHSAHEAGHLRLDGGRGDRRASPRASAALEEPSPRALSDRARAHRVVPSTAGAGFVLPPRRARRRAHRRRREAGSSRARAALLAAAGRAPRRAPRRSAARLLWPAAAPLELGAQAGLLAEPPHERGCSRSATVRASWESHSRTPSPPPPRRGSPRCASSVPAPSRALVLRACDRAPASWAPTRDTHRLLSRARTLSSAVPAHRDCDEATPRSGGRRYPVSAWRCTSTRASPEVAAPCWSSGSLPGARAARRPGDAGGSRCSRAHCRVAPGLRVHWRG